MSSKIKEFDTFITNNQQIVDFINDIIKMSYAISFSINTRRIRFQPFTKINYQEKFEIINSEMKEINTKCKLEDMINKNIFRINYDNYDHCYCSQSIDKSYINIIDSEYIDFPLKSIHEINHYIDYINYGNNNNYDYLSELTSYIVELNTGKKINSKTKKYSEDIRLYYENLIYINSINVNYLIPYFEIFNKYINSKKIEEKEIKYLNIINNSKINVRNYISYIIGLYFSFKFIDEKIDKNYIYNENISKIITELKSNYDYKEEKEKFLSKI